MKHLGGMIDERPKQIYNKFFISIEKTVVKKLNSCNKMKIIIKNYLKYSKNNFNKKHDIIV